MSGQVSCPQCGTRNESDAAFCEGCGQQVVAASPSSPASAPAKAPATFPISWLVVALIALAAGAGYAFQGPLAQFVRSLSGSSAETSAGSAALPASSEQPVAGAASAGGSQARALTPAAPPIGSPSERGQAGDALTLHAVPGKDGTQLVVTRDDRAREGNRLGAQSGRPAAAGEIATRGTGQPQAADRAALEVAERDARQAAERWLQANPHQSTPQQATAQQQAAAQPASPPQPAAPQPVRETPSAVVTTTQSSGASASTSSAARPAPMPEPESRERTPTAASWVEVPAGTEIAARLSSGVNSGKVKVEDRVEAMTTADVMVAGRPVIPSGSVLRGIVSSVQPATRINRTAHLTLTFDRVTLRGQVYSLKGTVPPFDGAGIKGDTKKIATGAGIGAIIGGLLGGAKGAGVGAAVGGGGTVAATEGQEVDLPPGTIVRVRLDSALTVEPATP